MDAMNQRQDRGKRPLRNSCDPMP